MFDPGTEHCQHLFLHHFFSVISLPGMLETGVILQQIGLFERPELYVVVNGVREVRGVVVVRGWTGWKKGWKVVMRMVKKTDGARNYPHHLRKALSRITTSHPPHILLNA